MTQADDVGDAALRSGKAAARPGDAWTASVRSDAEETPRISRHRMHPFPPPAVVSPPSSSTADGSSPPHPAPSPSSSSPPPPSQHPPPSLGARSRPPASVLRPLSATFYSVSSMQPGLAGIDLGHLLVLRAAAMLRAEFPSLRVLATLSPVPKLATWASAELFHKGDRAEGKGGPSAPDGGDGPEGGSGPQGRNARRSGTSSWIRSSELEAIRAAMPPPHPPRDGTAKAAGRPTPSDAADVVARALAVGGWLENEALAAALRPVLLRLTARYLLLERRRYDQRARGVFWGRPSPRLSGWTDGWVDGWVDMRAWVPVMRIYTRIFTSRTHTLVRDVLTNASHVIPTSLLHVASRQGWRAGSCSKLPPGERRLAGEGVLGSRCGRALPGAIVRDHGELPLRHGTPGRERPAVRARGSHPRRRDCVGSSTMRSPMSLGRGEVEAGQTGTNAYETLSVRGA